MMIRIILLLSFIFNLNWCIEKPNIGYFKRMKKYSDFNNSVVISKVQKVNTTKNNTFLIQIDRYIEIII